MSLIRYGIIGSGMMGLEHIRNINLIDNAEVVAIADPNDEPQEWAKVTLEYHGGPSKGAGVRYYTDHRELLDAGDVDALVIATPNFTHKAIAGDVLGSSLHVLMEKPLCTTLEDCHALQEAANGHDGVIWMGLEYRYMPPVTKFVEMAQGGVVGTPHMLSIREHRFPFLPKVGDWNRFNHNTGGTFVEKCCHFFDLMCLVMGDKPVRVFGSGGQNVNHKDEEYGGRQPDIFDNGFVVVDFEKGGRAMLDLCMFAEGSQNQEEISLVGDKAKLEVAIPDGHITLSNRQRERDRFHVPVPPDVLEVGQHHGATYYQHKEFVEAIRTGVAPSVTIEDGVLSVAIGVAAHTSMETGHAVRMSDLGF